MGMMLEAFANDNLQPGSRFFKRDSEYGRAIKRVADTEEALRAMLRKPERELLEELMDAQGELSGISDTDRFIYGYRLGVLMTVEVFAESDKLLAGV